MKIVYFCCEDDKVIFKTDSCSCAMNWLYALSLHPGDHDYMVVCSAEVGEA